MDFKEFKQSLISNEPPDSAGLHLKALWHEAKGDWEKAHNIIQDIHDTDAAAIHAYLHRKEGDQWNADYWYRRAGSKSPKLTLDEEWATIARRLIQ
jgi:hypothetical protein